MKTVGLSRASESENEAVKRQPGIFALPAGRTSGAAANIDVLLRLLFCYFRSVLTPFNRKADRGMRLLLLCGIHAT